MYKILCIVALVSLAGCATPQQNAMLGGAIIGAAVANAAAPAPRVVQRPLVCQKQWFRDNYGYLHQRTICR